MRLRLLLIGVAAVATAMMASPLAAQPGRGVAPKGPLNTLLDVRDAILRLLEVAAAERSPPGDGTDDPAEL